MAEDFGYCWRTVRLYCPSAPTFLAREWVQAAWKQLLSARRWGFMRGQLTLTSDGVTPYVTLPTDFASFRTVVDQSRQVKLPFNGSLDELRCKDPSLSMTGSPTQLLAESPSTDVSTLGQARYRVYPNGASTLTAIYNKQGDRLSDVGTFSGVLANGAEVLVAGALAEAALWPGTGEKPNPYFNAGLAMQKQAEFKTGIQMLSLRDDEQYPDDLWDSWPDACACGVSGDLRQTDFSTV